MKFLLYASLLFSSSIAFSSQILEFKEIGKASSWDDARALCQKLGDGWDLPTRSQMVELVISGHSPKMWTPVGTEAFPLWTREEGEADNATLKGTSLVYFLETNKGYDPQALDVSPLRVKAAQDRLQDMKNDVSPYIQQLGHKGAKAYMNFLEDFIKKTEGGYTVYCVLSF